MKTIKILSAVLALAFSGCVMTEGDASDVSEIEAELGSDIINLFGPATVCYQTTPIRVSLQSDPGGSLTVTLSATTPYYMAPSTVTFTSADWSTQKTVYLKNTTLTPRATTITATAPGYASKTLTLPRC